MGAEHLINRDQLTLFERAGDLIDPDKFTHVDVQGLNPVGPVDKEIHKMVFTRKLNETKEPSPWTPNDKVPLYDKIKEQGVRTPVPLTYRKNAKPRVDNGHHRIAAQNDIDPNAYIPVVWG